MLIERCGYTNDARKYKDVFNPDGVSVEVKTVGDHRDPYEYTKDMLNELRTRKTVWEVDISDYVIFFKRNDEAGTYTVDGMYVWNGQKNAWRKEK